MKRDGASARSAGISDAPLQFSRDDALRFKPYVNVLASFVRHPDTSAPLTLSVEGAWGSGKSTFLNLVAEQLRYEGDQTVWFDAWRHERDESMFADFGLELLRQLRASVPLHARVSKSILVLLTRFEWFESLPLLLILLSQVALVALLTLVAVNVVAHSETIGAGHDWIVQIIRSGGIVGYIAALAWTLRQVITIVDKPRFGALAQYARNPSYAKHASFVEEAARDIARVIDVWMPDRRLYVFIDDVDRCRPDGVSELIRALGLLTSTQVSDVVFIVGMDRTMVAAALASRYADTIPYLLRTDPSFRGDDKDYALAFAFSFLDKFINIPFRVPGVEKTDVNQLMVDFNASLKDPHRHRMIKHLEAPKMNHDSEELRRAIADLAFAFDYNPRRIKRFVNVLRLSDLVAAHAASPVHFMQLAKFTTLTLTWPLLIEDIVAKPSLLADLQRFADLGEIEPSDQLDRMKVWLNDERLLRVLRVGEADSSASLATVSPAALLWANRVRLNPSAFFNETGTRAYWNKATRKLMR
jgi:KAP-like P-loop domain-containing protein